MRVVLFFSEVAKINLYNNDIIKMSEPRVIIS